MCIIKSFIVCQSSVNLIFMKVVKFYSIERLENLPSGSNLKPNQGSWAIRWFFPNMWEGIIILSGIYLVGEIKHKVLTNAASKHKFWGDFANRQMCKALIVNANGYWGSLGFKWQVSHSNEVIHQWRNSQSTKATILVFKKNQVLLQKVTVYFNDKQDWCQRNLPLTGAHIMYTLLRVKHWLWNIVHFQQLFWTLWSGINHFI